MKIQLRCVFAYRTVDPADLWSELFEIVDSLGRSSSRYSFYGRTRKPEGIVSTLQSSDRSSFDVSDDRFDFNFCPIAKHRLDQLIVTTTEEDLVDPYLWIKNLAATEILIQAFLFNDEYDFWQNATDPLQFRSHGRECDHLPMCSNGLPPPLEQTVIDVSKNPGKLSLRNGYIEGVSNPIWLGERFWDRVRKQRDQVLDSDVWRQVRELDNGLVCLHSHRKPFDASDDEQTRIQNQVRNLLYEVTN
ncbi:MAG: hypothetical protein AAF664_10205 [Planctomycetota bacterium]